MSKFEELINKTEEGYDLNIKAYWDYVSKEDLKYRIDTQEKKILIMDEHPGMGRRFYNWKKDNYMEGRRY